MIYRRWPLFDMIVTKYFDGEGIGWTPASEWESQDLVMLESFANAELQRRGEQHDRDNSGRIVH